LERAIVRSRAKLDYAGAADADAGRLVTRSRCCPRSAAARAGLERGAINLPIPEQEVELDGSGCAWCCARPIRRGLNAQISC
jgi:hypothetical protein